MGDVAMLFWSQDLHSQSLEPTPNMIDTNLPFFCKNLSLELISRTILKPFDILSPCFQVLGSGSTIVPNNPELRANWQPSPHDAKSSTHSGPCRAPNCNAFGGKRCQMGM